MYHCLKLRGCLPNPPHPKKSLPATTCAELWRTGSDFDVLEKDGRKSGWRWIANWIEPMSPRLNARAGTCPWPTLNDWLRRWRCLPGRCWCQSSRVVKSERNATEGQCASYHLPLFAPDLAAVYVSCTGSTTFFCTEPSPSETNHSSIPLFSRHCLTSA